jgi:hypothetical protein
MAEGLKGLKRPKGLKSKLLDLTLSRSHSLKKKGGTELALGTPKTPKNQLKTISFLFLKQICLLHQMKGEDTSIENLNCYAIHIVRFFYH